MTSAPADTYAQCVETANWIREQVPEALRSPEVGVICGSGLGGLADTVENDVRLDINYADIPNFPKSTGMSWWIWYLVVCWRVWGDGDVGLLNANLLLGLHNKVQGHAGKLVFGYLGGNKTPSVLMVGRAQYVHLDWKTSQVLTVAESMEFSLVTMKATISTKRHSQFVLWSC